MTDTVFYDEMDQLATELLTDFGSPATYRTWPNKQKPDSTGKVSKPAPVDVPGLGVRTSNEQVLNMFEKPATVAMVVKFPTDPAPEGHIIHAGETLKVVEARLTKPLGTFMIVGFVSLTKP